MRTGARYWMAIWAAGCGARDDGSVASATAAVQSPVGKPASSIDVDLSIWQTGRLTSAGNGLYRHWNQYDALGRTTKVQHIIGDSSYLYSSNYGYPQGSVAVTGPGTVVTSSTFPDGETVSYTYDAGGGQQAIATTPAGGAAQTVVSKIVRNVRGQTTEVDYGNGARQLHCYDDGLSCNGEAMANTDLRLFRIATILNGTKQQYTYAFDANGNVTAVTDVNADATANYTYDSLDWLRGGTFTFVYDNIGNLTAKDGVQQKYFASGANSVHPHAISSAGSLTYGYDANGNLITRSDGLRVTWNSENMPVQVSGGAATSATSKYFLGESLVKKVQGGTTTYYLPSMRVENGAARKFYATFAERDPADGKLKFYHGDHLGSATLVSDSNGTVVRRASYKPYGQDRATPVAAFVPKYQFTFKEKENDGTGFYDYGARLYDPAVGRWLSADPVGADGQNRYAYVRNNPLHYTDPTGHSAFDEQNSSQPPVQDPKKDQPPPPEPKTESVVDAIKHEVKEQANDPSTVAHHAVETLVGEAAHHAMKDTGHAQAQAARLIRTTKGTPMEGYARLNEAAKRGGANTFRRVSKVAPVVELGILTIDGVRIVHATTTGNPDHPAFNDAAGHGGGVLGGIGLGAAMGAWCGPWCAGGGAIVGAFLGEAGMRRLQKKLTEPPAPGAPTTDPYAQHMIDACGAGICK